MFIQIVSIRIHQEALSTQNEGREKEREKNRKEKKICLLLLALIYFPFQTGYVIQLNRNKAILSNQRNEISLQ